MTGSVSRRWRPAVAVAVALVALSLPVRAQEAAPPAAPEAPPSPEPVPPEPLTDSAPPQEPPVLGPLNRGTGPGLPWQVVLPLQLGAYMAADILPYLGCVVGSWVVSLAVPLGPGVLLPVLVSLLLIPPVATLSGCASAMLLQWLGDRLGTQRGRLACVGCTSVSLSALSYALVIAPITIGMGFFSAAAYTLAASRWVLPRFTPPGVAPWMVQASAYSVTAAGAVLAVLVVLAGAGLAPSVGFGLRPALVSLVYRWTGRDRVAGEDQWPPSLLGERSDLLPGVGRRHDDDAAPPAAPAPASAQRY